ncbi:uncharacterized protein BP5553_01909 [Venustampulla echinocandica]|uniref:DNA polymerase epsilon subunit D n=1 Tax=Venustampulla echinocandica TaxID=2656787 RepID=A0A370U2C1_9HELO|nr:uncharacterized protein BP5553_01909 [Venustampulla echinocandica]RDL41930.1 hypothetical protein BP5553_01909 [Venustampulla echinocandica]
MVTPDFVDYTVECDYTHSPRRIAVCTITMPPKKADASKAGTGDEGIISKDPPMRDGINIEDLNLPKSIVTRLAKGVLPPNTQIQGNAMLAMTKSATVFVNYLASHANEHAVQQNRRTLQTGDVFAALDELEFSDWKPRLEAELAKFNEIQSEKRNTYRKKLADKSGQGDDTQAGEGDEADHDSQGEAEGRMGRDGQPAAKKARLEPKSKSAGAKKGKAPGKQNEADQTADEEGEDDESQEEEDDEEDEEEGNSEPQEGEELEETQEKEAEDEALDNGEDSD